MTTPTTGHDHLTLEEKASLTSGETFWTTSAVERAGIPSIMVADGPHGLRKEIGTSEHLGLNQSVPATCFPPACALGSTFDTDLAERVGAAIGAEAAIEDVAVVLGPGVNIKRSPLCGRNFEYLSEDPLVSGILGSALVRGIQSQGVGASLKHFAANNQEHDRMRSSSDVDPRTLREIYLRGFERVVKDAAPWTVMCSYNRVNGVYASENPWLLTRVLREEWGFGGLVVSDWGAVSDRVAGIAAGLDLEMPSSGGRTDAEIVAAVRAGALEEGLVDLAVDRILGLVSRAQERPARSGPLDVDAHHALAREAASRAIVLLKNDDAGAVPLLPLAPEASIAVIGEFARTPRFQGGGSSHINPTRVDSALAALEESRGAPPDFAPGFSLDGSGDAGALRDEAVAVARRNDVAVVFLGLTDAEETEGLDRSHIDLPASQLALLDAVLEVNPRTVVVLSHGSVVALPFADRVPAILDAWLLGQAGGSATADVLTGERNPSGRLAETIPNRLEDTPAFGNFPGSFGHVRYGEGILVGYRWYDTRRMSVAFPFGHGLSYTRFDYGAPSTEITGDGDIRVRVPVTNAGTRDGREVVQVYVTPEVSAVERPARELRAFDVVEIPAGETRVVDLVVRREDLGYWDTRVDRFVVEGGSYGVEVAASSRDIRGVVSIDMAGDEVRVEFGPHSTLGEVLAHPVAGPAALRILGVPVASAADSEAAAVPAELLLFASLPLNRLPGFGGLTITGSQISELIDLANG